MIESSAAGERRPVVLIANDQEWTARAIESILAPAGVEVVRAFTGSQALQGVRSSRPDLVICDAQLPDMHGFEVCRTLRADPAFGAALPIVITTAGPAGRQQRIEAYRAGAWEFFGQPLDAEALLPRLETFIQAHIDAESLRDAGLLDAATGLYNLRGLTRRTREILTHAHRRQEALSCIVVVVDPAASEGEDDSGRRVGEQVASALREAGRTADAIARISPREFAIVAPATEADGVERLVVRLGQRAKVKLRAGYCTVAPAIEALEPSEMLLRATSAAHEAVRRGNGTIALAFGAPQAH